VFIDETGVNLAMARHYGRAKRGHRAIGTVPKNYGLSVTLIGAIDAHGLVATLSFRGATDTSAMTVYLKEVLLPELKRGDCVVWDNLAVHKTRAVQELFREAGVELLFLPPYSPDLNPIELCWSKLKTYLRAAGARTYEKLSAAISAAIKKITASDARNWMRHCGYVSHLL
jgi:transposase